MQHSLGVESEPANETPSSEIEDLMARVEYLESIVLQRQDRATYFEESESVEKVKGITQAIFGDTFNVVEQDDCDNEGQKYYEVQLKFDGDLDDLLEQHDRWHATVSELPENVRALFSLSFLSPDDDRR